MKRLRFISFVFFTVIVCVCLAACSSSSNDDNNSSANGLENKVIGIWTGTSSSDLSKVFHRWEFNSAHVVKSYWKTAERSYIETDGVRTYTNWSLSNEGDRIGTWEIIDGAVPRIHINWNNGGQQYIGLFQFDGSALYEDLGYYLYKGDSNPDF
jgi:hypothetical protein